MSNDSYRYTQLMKRWQKWKYKNTLLFVISMVFFAYLLTTPTIHELINQTGQFGYVSAFIAGLLFVSIFTTAPAAVVLFQLAEQLHIVEVALIAGLGAMVGDYFVLRFMKDKLFKELIPLARKLNEANIAIVFKSPYFAWLLPVFGAFIIASPFPDEVGVGMLGLSKVKQWQFFLVTFSLNAVGIFLVVSATRI